MHEKQQGGPVEHHLAVALDLREQLLVVEGDDRQWQGEEQKDNGECAEEEDVVEQAKEEVGIVKASPVKESKPNRRKSLASATILFGVP